MSIDDIHTTSDERTRLLDELQGLLERQLQLARQGASTNEQFGVLTAKADSLVDEIVRIGVLDLPEFQYRYEQLRSLYENLCLAVASEKSDVSKELARARRGRRIIAIYHTNDRAAGP